VGYESGEEGNLQLPQKVGYPVNPQGVKARVAGNHLQYVPGGGISLENAFYVINESHFNHLRYSA
jgi:hypothetical protein